MAERDWTYAAGNPTRYTDPDGRLIVDESTGEVTVEDNDTNEDLMWGVALYGKYISPERRRHLDRVLEMNQLNFGGEELEQQDRIALYSTLTLGLQDYRGGRLGEVDDQGVLEAYAHMRADGRRIVRAARDASKEGYEGTEMLAGLLGVPTSKADLAISAIPVAGGVLKIGKGAFKKAFRAVIGKSGEDALRALQHTPGVEFVERHIGAAGDVRPGKFNPLNPSGRGDNCVAGVCALLRNKLERRSFDPLSADEIERLFGWTGKDRKFTEATAMTYMNQALQETGHRVGGIVPFMQRTGGAAPGAGHYVIFAGRSGAREHVLYGRILPNGERFLYDPQFGARVEWSDVVNRYGGAVARPIEAAE